MPDLDEIITRRRSVRGFDRGRAVPRSALREAFTLAARSPSNCNAQPWRVFVASGAACERVRASLCARFDSGDFGQPDDPIDTFEGDYRRLQVACAVELYGHMGVGRHDMDGRLRALRRNFELFDAPHVAIVCMHESFGVGVALDVGIYVQTLMLALEARGVASCAQAALRHYPSILRAELAIPEELRVLCGVSFGYEDASVPANATRQSREPLEHTTTFIDA